MMWLSILATKRFPGQGLYWFRMRNAPSADRRRDAPVRGLAPDTRAQHKKKPSLDCTQSFTVNPPDTFLILQSKCAKCANLLGECNAVALRDIMRLPWLFYFRCLQYPDSKIAKITAVLWLPCLLTIWACEWDGGEQLQRIIKLKRGKDYPPMEAFQFMPNYVAIRDLDVIDFPTRRCGQSYSP
jgi:hypothetical protein